MVPENKRYITRRLTLSVNSSSMRLYQTTATAFFVVARYCHTIRNPLIRRKYVSRMFLNSLGKQKEGPAQCKSADVGCLI